MTWVVFIIHFSSPSLNRSSVRFNSIIRIPIEETTSLNSLEIFIVIHCRSMHDMIRWIVVKSLAWSDVWRMCPSHECMRLQALVSPVTNVILFIIVIFEYLATEFVVSDLTIASVSSSNESLDMIRLRNIVHCQLFVELTRVHVASSKILNGIAQVLLLLISKLSLLSQVNISCTQPTEGCSLLIDRSILSLLW